MYTRYPDRIFEMKKRKNRKLRFMYHIPPVAFPVNYRNNLSGFIAAFQPSKSLESFRQSLMSQTQTKNCFLVNSGRSALTMILRGLKNDTSSNKVLIPAYSCSTVLQSVITAGLEPVFCDVDLNTLDFDQGKLTGMMDIDLLAVVGVHLYGLAHDYTELVNITRAKGAFFIEDAAQSYGSKIGNTFVGIQGDAGFYSFGRGKCLPVGHGGAIVANSEIHNKLTDSIGGNLTQSSLGLKYLLSLIGYQLAVNPYGWWLVSRSGLNPASAGSDYQQLPPIKHSPLSAVQAGIGDSMIGQSEEVYKKWRTNAELLISMLEKYDFLQIPKVREDSQPVYLRLPVIIDERARTNRLYEELEKAGVGVSRSYRFTLPELYSKITSREVGRYPSAEHLAGNLLTLPTNSFLREETVEMIDQIFYAEKKTEGGE